MEHFGDFCSINTVGKYTSSICSKVNCNDLKDESQKQDCLDYQRRQKEFWDSPFGILFIIVCVIFLIYVFLPNRAKALIISYIPKRINKFFML
jgi:hypothetical protein